MTRRSLENFLVLYADAYTGIDSAQNLVHPFWLGACYYTPRGQGKDIMSDASRSHSLADQHIDLPSTEQSQLSIYPPWYPYEVSRPTLYSNYTNVLLVFVPIGIAAGALGWDPVTVFSLNFLAIIPLAPLIAFSTRELSASLGHVLGGLLKEALSNSAEIVVRHLCLSLMPYFTFFA
jgi:hypothetical protein